MNCCLSYWLVRAKNSSVSKKPRPSRQRVGRPDSTGRIDSPYSRCWDVSSRVVRRIENRLAPPLSMPIATSCAAPAKTMADRPWPSQGVRLASMAMEPASNPQGATARDNGRMAMAPRIKAWRANGGLGMDGSNNQ
ncbi:hypothetical protein D3C79_915380 [compost metagenome]